MIESLMSTAKRWIEMWQQRMESAPLVVLFLKDDRRVATGFVTLGEDKQLSMAEMLSVAPILRADRLILIQDTWMKSVPPEEFDDALLPSEDPESLDMLLLLDLVAEGLNAAGSSVYRLADDGTIEWDDEDGIEDPGLLQSWMIDMAKNALTLSRMMPDGEVDAQQLAWAMQKSGHVLMLHGS